MIFITIEQLQINKGDDIVPKNANNVGYANRKDN